MIFDYNISMAKLENNTQLNKLSTVTLQEQLYSELLNKIKQGVFKPGDMITSELKLSEEYGVSRITVRNSIQQLVDEGYLRKRKGKGTFVNEFIYTEALYKGGSFTENCLQRNAKPSTEIVECKLTIGDPEMLESLGCKSNKLIEITRIRKVDDVACIVEVDYFPDTYDFLLTNKIENTSLLNLIAQKTGVTPAKFIDYFSIAFANKDYAHYLDCPMRTPLLQVKQLVKTSSDKLIYMNMQYIITSRYVYVKS